MKSTADTALAAIDQLPHGLPTPPDPSRKDKDKDGKERDGPPLTPREKAMKDKNFFRLADKDHKDKEGGIVAAMLRLEHLPSWPPLADDAMLRLEHLPSWPPPADDATPRGCSSW